MAVVELIDSRSVETDGSQSRASRTFLVDAISEEDALVQPGVPAVGVLADPFPGLSALKADNKRGQRTDAPGKYKVVVSYSTFRGGRLPDRPRTNEPGQKSYSFSNFSREVSIPGAKKITITGDGPLAGKDVWMPFPLKYFAKYASLEVTVYVSSFSNSQNNFIVSSIGQIHEFPDGSRWRFGGGTADQTGGDIWTINYRWERREPISAVQDDHDPRTVFPTEVLDPFKEWMVIAADTATSPPLFLQVSIGGSVSDNWQDLPGNPIP